MSNRLHGAFLTFIGVVALSGCGQGDGARVAGSVTYNGEPIENGAITFQAVGGDDSFSASIVNGQYSASAAPSGQYKASIQATTAAESATSREAFQQQAGATAQQPANYIPVDAQGNGQSVVIKEGEQTLDFALTGPPRK
jgi:hypothetical protein